jgi:acetyltransferase-like isoleucine patch superfamily enzyme
MKNIFDHIKIGKLFRINIIATCRANLNAGTLFPPKILVLSKCSLILKKNAKIKCDARLVFNHTWYGRNFSGSYLCLKANSTLWVKRNCKIYRNADISVSPGALLELECAIININAQIHCTEHIFIGEGTIIAEGVRIRDHDNHKIFKDGVMGRLSAPIHIGKHVWIGMNVCILKGVSIGDGAVVAAGSVVVRDVAPHTLVGGSPARFIRDNVHWE